MYCRREDVLSRLLWAFFLFLSVWRYKLDEWPMFRCDKVTGDMHCWYCNFQLTMCEVLLLNLQAINAIVMNHVNASLCDLQIRRMDILNLQIRRDYWEIILVSFLINFIFMHVLFLNIGILNSMKQKNIAHGRKTPIVSLYSSHCRKRLQMPLSLILSTCLAINLSVWLSDSAMHTKTPWPEKGVSLSEEKRQRS